MPGTLFGVDRAINSPSITTHEVVVNSRVPGQGLAADASAISARQNSILDYARTHGEVHVELLVEAYGVTPQTIRRDLNALCQLRLMQRVHGGAVVVDGVENLGYQARRALSAAEKSDIGRHAAALIPADSSLFINIGTTTEQVAEHLSGHTGLLVVTNNINVVNTLRANEGITVMTAGGVVRSQDGGVVGDATVEFIQQFRLDYAVIGASAIEPDGTILDYDMREVRVAQAIIANARAVILVADSVKFERKAPIRIGSISAVDYFVTDKTPTAGFMQVCDTHGVSVSITAHDLGQSDADVHDTQASPEGD